MPGPGFMDGDIRWAIVGAVLAVVGRRRCGWTAFRARRDGLSQAAQVASAGPAVTSLPWRTSGRRSRRTSASSRATMLGVVEPQVAETGVPVGARRLVEQGRPRPDAR